jgi:hypothetical protein
VNWASWLYWGFTSTLILTAAQAAAQGLGLTRMNMPFMLGTIFTENRDKAKLYGFLIQLMNGWLFSLLYIGAFEMWSAASWWRGALIGVVHGLFVLLVVVAMLPGIHPRMATEQHGPTASRDLEPPGFLALNYGLQTPVSIIVSHAIFGALLGGFYTLAK